MKKYIIVLLALLIFSCNEDNIVKDDRVKTNREGWVVIDSIQINYESGFRKAYPVNILDVKENTLYLRINIGIADFEGWIYKKTINQEPEYISEVWGQLYNFYENIIFGWYGLRLVISDDYGRNYAGVDTNSTLESMFFRDGMKKNDDLYVLAAEQGLIKMNNDLITYEIIDSSFFKTEILYGKEAYYNPYKYFNIFDNNNCLLFDFYNNEILFISENFSKKELIHPNNEILKEFIQESNYICRDWISVVSENIIYCRTRTGVFKTINKGKDWSLILDEKIKYFSKLVALNENLIYLLDIDNDETLIYASTDGGRTFEIQEIPNGVEIFDFHFVNENLGYAVCRNGEILKTTSGGFKDK